MSLNYKEIDAVLAELDLENSFVQNIVQPGYDSLALHVYKTAAKTVYICLAAGECRIHETRRPIPKNKTPLRFMEFLKSRIKGAKIQSCRQIGSERIIEIKLMQAQTPYILFIRLWSGAANIIVTDENLHILDVFYRRPKRNEVSGGTFILPEKKSISAENKAHIKKADTEADGNSEKKNFEKNGFEKNDFRKRDFTAEEYAECFKDIDIASLSFNEQLDLWYGEYGNTSSRTLLLAQAEKAYNQKVGRIQNALLKLEEKRAAFLNADLWKHQGDLILANAHSIGTSSAKILVCTDYGTGQSVSIQIDPKKNAAENAAVYYERYKKARSGLSDLEKDIADLKEELESVRGAYKSVCAEENPIRIRQFLQRQSAPQKVREKKQPGVSFSIGEWHILVGRNASENDELLRHHVKGLDWWLHTRDYAGGYVFIKNKRGKTVPLEILIDAGNLAVFYSKARNAKTADLYYTQVKHLRRAKNAPKGTVLPTHEKNITVTLDNERIRKMEKMKTYD